MSLVEELQSDALKETVPVCELLNKSLIVATKLNQVEFGEWIRLELDGYGTKKVPEYRMVHGTPQVFNPYRGYQPLFFGDPKHKEKFSVMHFNQPIGEIEHAFKSADKNNSSFQISYNPKTEKMLMNAIEFNLQPSLHVNATEFLKILNAVRKNILEWSLKLEQDGIVGTGMSFSKEEKERAQSVTYNIKNYVQTGNTSQVQIESVASTQHLENKTIDITELKKVLDALNEAINQLKLDSEEQAELTAEMRTLESQASSPKPKDSIIRESLSSVTRILEGAAGDLVASGVLDQIGNLF